MLRLSRRLIREPNRVITSLPVVISTSPRGTTNLLHCRRYSDITSAGPAAADPRERVVILGSGWAGGWSLILNLFNTIDAYLPD